MENFHSDALLRDPEVILIRLTSSVYHHHLLRSGALLPLSTASRLCWWRHCRLLSKHIIIVHTRCCNKQDLIVECSEVTLQHWIPFGLGLWAFVIFYIKAYEPEKIYSFIWCINIGIHTEWENCQQNGKLHVCKPTVCYPNPSRRLMVD